MKPRPLFISYASEDKDVASHVVLFLEDRGQKCWIAPRNIPPSADWAESIIDGIDSASGMVLLLSRHSNVSPQVRREVERAVDRRIAIYPLVMERIELSKWMQYYISSYQWSDSSDVSLSTRLAELFEAIQRARAKEESDMDINVIFSKFADDLASLSAELDESGNESERLLPGEKRSVSVLHIAAGLSDREVFSSVRMVLWKTMANLIERYVGFYGGYLDRLSLSSYRCVFGLEQVREDDGRRALSCGICLCSGFNELNSVLKRKGLRVDFGLGIASGMVSVDNDGEAVSSPHGEVLLLARELAESASRSLLVNGAFYHTVDEQYSWEEHSNGVYKIVDCIAALPGSRVLSMTSPFVGREGEILRLASLLELQAAGTGLNSRGGAKHLLMCIRGEAGIGKSRLVYEFVKKHCSGDEFVVLRGQTLSFAQPPFWLCTTVLRDLLSIEPGSDLDYQQFLARLGGESNSLIDSAPFLASLLSIDSGDRRLERLDSRAIALETGIAFNNLLETISENKKVVVVLEDLHWLEEGDRKILKFVTENCTTQRPIVFLLVYRPESEDGVSVQFDTNTACYVSDSIEVAEVDEGASKDLIMQLLGNLSDTRVHQVAPQILGFLLDRSGGNPFYLEELIFDLIERGALVHGKKEWKMDTSADGLFVPDSLVGLILSRLERLPESWKSVLQNSSVLGMEFQLKLYWKLVNKLFLGRCHSDVFEGLEVKQMLLSKMSAFDKKYLFRHIFVRDTAYSTILEDNLKKLHRAAAESIEEMFPGDRERVSGILMHHWEKSGDKTRAIDWGFKAIAQYTGKEALKLSRRLENLIEGERKSEQHEDNVFKLLSYVEKAQDILALREQQGITIEDMIRIAENSGSDYRMATALKKRAALALVTGCMDMAFSDLKRALELTRRAGDRSFEGIVLGNLGSLLMNQGRKKEAREHFERALVIHREFGDQRSEGIILMNLGVIHKAEGNMDEARFHYENALEIAHRVGDRRTVGDIQVNLGNLLWTLGFLNEAGEYYKNALIKQHEIGNRRTEGILYCNLGILNMHQKHMEEALSNYEKALDIIHEIGDDLVEGSILGNLGVLYANQGMLDEAQVQYERALDIHRRVGNRQSEGVVLGNIGNIHMKQESLVEARECYERSLEVSSEIGDELDKASVLANLGCLCFKEGDVEEAFRCYGKSYKTATDMKLGRDNFDGLADLHLKLLSAGYSAEEIPWPAHWESCDDILEEV